MGRQYRKPQTPKGREFQMVYAVEVTVSATGVREISRFFNTIAAARKWAKWCRKQSFVSAARIMAGGAGGMEVV